MNRHAIMSKLINADAISEKPVVFIAPESQDYQYISYQTGKKYSFAQIQEMLMGYDVNVAFKNDSMVTTILVPTMGKKAFRDIYQIYTKNIGDEGTRNFQNPIEFIMFNDLIQETTNPFNEVNKKTTGYLDSRQVLIDAGPVSDPGEIQLYAPIPMYMHEVDNSGRVRTDKKKKPTKKARKKPTKKARKKSTKKARKKPASRKKKQARKLSTDTKRSRGSGGRKRSTKQTRAFRNWSSAISKYCEDHKKKYHTACSLPAKKGTAAYKEVYSIFTRLQRKR